MTQENKPYIANVARVTGTFDGVREDVISGDVYPSRTRTGVEGKPVTQHFKRPNGGELIPLDDTPYTGIQDSASQEDAE